MSEAIIRGAIRDRLWGKTLGALGRRGVTGQLTIRLGADRYAIVFDGGHVVAASAPDVSVLGIALAQDLLDVSQVAELEQGSDREQLLATLLTPTQLLRLRRQAIAAAAASTFLLVEGDFIVNSDISLPIFPGTAMHVGGLIYHGAITHLDDVRLIAAVRELGTTFCSRADGIADLQYFGFGEAQLVVVRALANGIALQQIERIPPAERRIALATVYTLASLGAVYCEAPAVAPRVARGTFDPTPTPRPPQTLAPRTAGPRVSAISIPTHGPRTPPRGTRPLPRHAAPQPQPAAEPKVAAAHYRRGQVALRDERLDDAIAAFALAVELAPDDHESCCALAWARFCKARDKAQAAEGVRAVLSQVAIQSERPVLAYYYLGMVERILGRTPQALAHFQQVLEIEPHHCAATIELRFLTRPKR